MRSAGEKEHIRYARDGLGWVGEFWLGWTAQWTKGPAIQTVGTIALKNFQVSPESLTIELLSQGALNKIYTIESRAKSRLEVFMRVTLLVTHTIKR